MKVLILCALAAVASCSGLGGYGGYGLAGGYGGGYGYAGNTATAISTVDDPSAPIGDIRSAEIDHYGNVVGPASNYGPGDGPKIIKQEVQTGYGAAGYGGGNNGGVLNPHSGACAGIGDGYLPDGNCNLYHACSNGLDWVMPCPAGLWWSQRLTRCVYPSQSECGKAALAYAAPAYGRGGYGH